MVHQLRNRINRFQLEEHASGNQLVVNYPPPKYEHFSPLLTPELVKKIESRDQQGGGCTARNLVPLRPGGETHKNIVVVADSVERLGVRSLLLQQINGKPCLNPAALAVSYALLSIANANIE